MDPLRSTLAGGEKVTPRQAVSDGSLVANFTSGVWTTNAGTPTLTQGHTGYDPNGIKTGITSRTGQPGMLKYVPAVNTAEGVRLASPGTALRTAALSGKFGMWVYLDGQPGYGAAGTPTGAIQVELTTKASLSAANGLFWSWTVDQLREGWNFLKFIQRDATAYSGSATEYHPLGVVAGKYGNCTDGNVVANPVTQIRINTSGLLGATLYFDSIWTGWTHKAEVVIGVDQIAADTIEYVLPDMQAKGWVGYIAAPLRVWSSGDKIITNPVMNTARLKTMYDAGWDVINHTANHVQMGTLTDPGEVAYEVLAARGYLQANGFTRGQEFYAAPKGSQSRVSEAVLANAGLVVQRAARKTNNTVTGFGVDKLTQVGSSDISSAGGNAISKTTAGSGSNVVGLQQFSKIKNVIDVMEAYGDTWFPFIHGVSTLGDSGSGEDLTGDNLIMTRSAWSKTLDYLAAREAAGGLRVRDGLTGWHYGTGR